jgi:hypothetical protein
MKVILVLGFLLVGTQSALAAANTENKSSTCCKTCSVDQGGCSPDAGNAPDQAVAQAPGDKVEKPGDSSEGK